MQDTSSTVLREQGSHGDFRGAFGRQDLPRGPDGAVREDRLWILFVCGCVRHGGKGYLVGDVLTCIDLNADSKGRCFHAM